MTQKDSGNNDSNRRVTEDRRRFLKQVGGAGAALPLALSATESSRAEPSSPHVSVPRREVGRARSVSPADVPRTDESDRDQGVAVPRMLPFTEEEYRRIQRRIQSGDFPQPPESDVQRVPDDGGENE